MPYSLSQHGLAFVARQEGFRAGVYEDVAGYATVGYGHKLGAGEYYPNGVTQEEALALLRQDAALAEQAVRLRVTMTLTQEQFDALVSLVFNIGGGAFARSTLLRLLNQGKYEQAAEQFLAWNKITLAGKRVPQRGLTSRRQAERVLFLMGNY